MVLALPLSVLSLRGDNPPALWRAVLAAAATWEIWALLTLPVAWLAERFPVERPLRARNVLVHLAAYLTTCIVQAASTAAASLALFESQDRFGDLFAWWLFLLMPAGIIVYSAVVALRLLQIRRAQVAARERESLELSAALADAKLMSLRAQIQPHFLFNALNAVVALIRDGHNQRAADAVITLSELLRDALHSSTVQEVTLADDVAFATRYLELERMRLGDTLQIAIDVPPALAAVRVPGLLLQPLVENAVRHGIRPHAGQGTVLVRARIIGDEVEIVIDDDGAGLAPDWEVRSAGGLGLANTRARLRQVYGDGASLRLLPRPGGMGTRVALRLPLHRERVAA